MATSVSKLIIRLQKFSSKVSKIIDATNSFNDGGYYIQDLSGWDSAVVQFVTPSAAVSFYTTNDDGAVQSQLLPSPEVPGNWDVVLGTNLATKVDASTTISNAIYEFGIIGKYLLLEGASTTTSSYAYVLSQNTYTTAGEAYNYGILQGTRIVYTTTDTLSNVNVLFTDSRLTQPIYGDGASWYGVALLSDQTVKYAITIDGAGVIVID
jgi:hypothetical protein